jgi:hypothetical protein
MAARGNEFCQPTCILHGNQLHKGGDASLDLASFFDLMIDIRQSKNSLQGEKK